MNHVISHYYSILVQHSWFTWHTWTDAGGAMLQAVLKGNLEALKKAREMQRMEGIQPVDWWRVYIYILVTI